MPNDLPPLPTITPAVLRHERIRQVQQRSASARRRAEALAGLVSAIGGQAEAARALGTSKAAVSKSLSDGRLPLEEGPPLADYLEIDLPRSGSQVPSLDEWREMPARDRAAAAERAERYWSAIATAAGRMADQARAASEWSAEVALMGDADDEPRPALIQDEDPAPATGDPSIAVYADMAESLTAKAREAWKTHDYWRALVMDN